MTELLALSFPCRHVHVHVQYDYSMITENLEIFMPKNIRKNFFRVKHFCTLTSLRNYLYNRIFLTKELVHVSLISSTAAEEYQHQSKRAKVHVGCHTKRTTSMAEVHVY